MKTNYPLVILVLFTALLAGCGSNARVGELQTESQSVELADAKSVNVNVNLGAGNLTVTGGAEKLLKADFTYNVARLKPEVEYTDGTLVVQQPEVEGLPDLPGITDFRNEWGLRLNNDVPMNLSVNMGAGNSDLQLAHLSLTRLNLILGAGTSTVDLNNDWMRDLDVTMDAGATNLSVQLPKDIGVRVNVEEGPHTVESVGLKQDGNVYTNAAYGVSTVTLQINIKAGIGRIQLEVKEPSQAKAALKNLLVQQVKNQNILGVILAERLADGTVLWDTSGYTDPSGKERWSAHILNHRVW